MKAITLWQPWASLIAVGAKTIETRGRQTHYRGPLAIHAATRRPGLMHLPPLERRRRAEEPPPTWLVVDTITDPAYTGPRPQGSRVPKRAQAPTLFFPSTGPHGRPHVPGTHAIEQGTAVYLPLGAVVATCELVDVVPTDTMEGFARIGDHDCDDPSCWLDEHEPPCDYGGRRWDLAENRPLGDFTPGRFAWLLADVEPVDPPVPASGRQWLWEWERER